MSTRWTSPPTESASEPRSGAWGWPPRVPLKASGKGVTAEFALNEGASAVFVLRDLPGSRGCGSPLSENEATELFRETVNYWRRWINRCTYTGRWREMVRRSALALKLMTYAPTGAIVAAPTCSLPESIGGSRNWDYRYTWIRDAAFYPLWVPADRVQRRGGALYDLAARAHP